VVVPKKPSGFNYMADLLYLPKTRQKYLYLLTMVDIWSNNCDFEPLKDKKADTVLKAMKKIFKRGILPQPQASIRTDNGTEFQDVFHKWLYDHNIFHRLGEPYRHQKWLMLKD
jgi:transposase InsO family protein